MLDVLSSNKYNTGEPAGWADGDFDGNGTFDRLDLLEAVAGDGFNMGPRPAAVTVPEPGSAPLALVAGAAILGFRRRR